MTKFLFPGIKIEKHLILYTAQKKFWSGLQKSLRLYEWNQKSRIMEYAHYIIRSPLLSVRTMATKNSALCISTRYWMKQFSRWSKLTGNLVVSGSDGIEMIKFLIDSVLAMNMP